MDIEQVLGKKGIKTLENALPCFFRKFNIPPDEGRKILKDHIDDLKVFIENTNSDNIQVKSEARKRVNIWWRRYHKDFGTLGLGQFRKASNPSQAEASYELLVILCFLTEKLESRQLIVRMSERVRAERITKPEPNVFVKIGRWIRRLLKRLFRKVGVSR